MYKLKSNNGRVSALFRTGNDLVKTSMGVLNARDMVKNGTLEESDQPGYPIRVGDWYFAGTKVAERKSKDE